jgi:diguanylate cyclase (GGDEF)-like protein
MNEDEIEMIMKKVFKREYAHLDTYEAIIEEKNLSKTELLDNYTQLLEAYRMLLHDAVKITKIGDINQKKLFEVNEDLELQKKILYLNSITDALTKVFNRASLMESLESEFAKNKRYQNTFSCILIDIDDFKVVNDNYGHLMGDLVLAKTASIIKKQLRAVDSFGRYGGEEFLIILPVTEAKEALLVAEKLRKKIAETEFIERGHNISISISQGISDSSIDTPKSQDDLLYKVDTALYQAKKKGKNCCVIYRNSAQSTFVKVKD